MSNAVMTHAKLCQATANRFVDKTAIYEYKSFASSEEPDVLVYGYTGTTLFEIKMSRADFLADAKKPCRRKYVAHWWDEAIRVGKDKVFDRARVRVVLFHPELYLKQAPHLGNRRYFVCEHGLIMPNEIPEGWGLYWYKSGKFYQKKESAKFRSNLKVENHLLIHAMRRLASGVKTGIVVNTYDKEK